MDVCLSWQLSALRGGPLSRLTCLLLSTSHQGHIGRDPSQPAVLRCPPLGAHTLAGHVASACVVIILIRHYWVLTRDSTPGKHCRDKVYYRTGRYASVPELWLVQFTTSLFCSRATWTYSRTYPVCCYLNTTARTHTCYSVHNWLYVKGLTDSNKPTCKNYRVIHLCDIFKLLYYIFCAS